MYASALQISYKFYLVGQFQSNSTDLFSTAAAVTRRYGSTAGFTRVHLCSTVRVNSNYYDIIITMYIITGVYVNPAQETTERSEHLYGVHV